MGACVVTRKKDEPFPVTFDKNELDVLNRVFGEYCALYVDTRRHQSLTVVSFMEIFSENPRFGSKLFDLLQVYGGQDKYITKNTLFEFLEAMLKIQFSTSNPEFKTFDRVELMALISIGNTTFLHEKNELKNLQVAYLQAIEIINDVYCISKCGQSGPPLNQKPCKAIVDSIYQNEKGSMDWNHFIQTMKQQMEGQNHYIQCYFANKFMRGGDIMPSIPSMNSPSYILNEDTLFQLLLSGFQTQLKGSNQLKLLYSNIVHPGGFPTLYKNLVDSNLPTLMLFQHEEHHQQLNDRSDVALPHTFGAISNHRWFNTALACGLPTDCMFSMYPQFQVLQTRREQGAQQNYCFLNYQKDPTLPQGIGFGGTSDGKDCRIWIDQDFQDNSYVKPQDDSYDTGYLVSPHIKKLKISLIEVWGIQHPAYDENRIEPPQVKQIQVQPKGILLNGNDQYKVSLLTTTTQVQLGPKPAFYWEQGDDDSEEEPQITSVVETRVVYTNSSKTPVDLYTNSSKTPGEVYTNISKTPGDLYTDSYKSKTPAEKPSTRVQIQSLQSKSTKSPFNPLLVSEQFEIIQPQSTQYNKFEGRSSNVSLTRRQQLEDNKDLMNRYSTQSLREKPQETTPVISINGGVDSHPGEIPSTIFKYERSRTENQEEPQITSKPESQVSAYSKSGKTIEDVMMSYQMRKSAKQ